MPTPSKFTEARRRVVIAALRCGASRRTAAKLAGVHVATLCRWVERGRDASPTGRWRAFHDAVIAAEGAKPSPGLLPPPPEPTPQEIRRAKRLIARTEWAPQDLLPPVTVEVVHDGTPIGGHTSPGLRVRFSPVLKSRGSITARSHNHRCRRRVRTDRCP